MFSSEILSKVFFQISIILFLYYDLISVKSLSSWHNASGDFVFKIRGSLVDVRLVSVRSFDAIFFNFDKKETLFSEKDLLYGLLVFFLQNSLRVRLDRLFGTGGLVFLNKMYLHSVVSGFLKGLSILISLYNFPQYFPDFFKTYFINCGFFDLKKILFYLVFKNYGKQLYDVYVILPKLNEHIACLREIIKNFIKS